MLTYRLHAFVLIATVFFIPNALSAQAVGVFQTPYDEGTVWNCGADQVGFNLHEHFLQWNPEVKPRTRKPFGYNIGEIWRGACGGDTDRGALLYALADGQVMYVDNDGASDKGKRVVVRYTLPDERTVDVEYLQCDSIFVRADVRWKGDFVTQGQQIATIGSAGIHWQIRIKKPFPLSLYEYQNPLSAKRALLFTAPALFVDDRRTPEAIPLLDREWTVFDVSGNAPSSTAYVEADGGRYSLQRAAEEGIIHTEVYSSITGAWEPYADISTVFFAPGVTYAVYSQRVNAQLVILIPGNNYRADRARLDMVDAADEYSRFAEVDSQNGYAEGADVGWEGFDHDTLELRAMKFKVSTNELWVYHITNRENALLRYTAYMDPRSGNWTDWRQVDWNTLPESNYPGW